MMRQIYSLFMRGDYQKCQQAIFFNENICEEKEQNHLPLNFLELESALTLELERNKVSDDIKVKFKNVCKTVLVKR